MTKSEFINYLAEKNDFLTSREAAVVVNTFFDSILEALVSGDKVELRGFGSFKVKQVGPRKGRNPKTGEVLDVPAKRTPYFRPGKELRRLLNS